MLFSCPSEWQQPWSHTMWGRCIMSHHLQRSFNRHLLWRIDTDNLFKGTQVYGFLGSWWLWYTSANEFFFPVLLTHLCRYILNPKIIVSGWLQGVRGWPGICLRAGASSDPAPHWQGTWQCLFFRVSHMWDTFRKWANLLHCSCIQTVLFSNELHVLNAVCWHIVSCLYDQILVFFLKWEFACFVFFLLSKLKLTSWWESL